MTSFNCAAGGTFISVRTARISEIARTSQFISAMAWGSVKLAANSGHSAEIRRLARLSASFSHSSSVMKGMRGCKRVQNLIEHVSGGGLGFLPRALVREQDRLDEFEIPVAERAPEEVIELMGGFIEPVIVEGLRHFPAQIREFAHDPAVDRGFIF